MTKNERVKIIREELKLDQLQFGELIGRKQGSISQIETGRVHVSEKFIKSLEKIGVNRIYIDFGKGEKFFAKPEIKIADIEKNINITPSNSGFEDIPDEKVYTYLLKKEISDLRKKISQLQLEIEQLKKIKT